MKRRGKKHGKHLANSGAYSNGNYPEFRYGPKKAITLAPVAMQSRILRGERRRSVVSQVMDVLRDWRQSEFEREADCRHGLRTALCLDGNGWQGSDDEAAAVVAEGLRTIGAERPGYAEGQWEYAVSPDYCAKCHGPLDDETRSKGRRFCSAICANIAYEQRSYAEVRTSYEVAKSAYIVIRTEEAPQLTCQHCARPFKRMGSDQESRQKAGKDKFCSVACHNASMVVYADRECTVCEKTFSPRNERQHLCSKTCMGVSQIKGPNRTCKACGAAFRFYRAASDPTRGHYCSKACATAGGTTVEISRTCDWCYGPYTARSSKSRFCGPRCRQQSVDIRNGTWKPKVISGPVFDHVFTRPIEEFQSSRLTPQRFDWMLMEQGMRITQEQIAA